MSRLAPDIPELQHLPDATRSLVYMRAFNSAIRSPLTWIIGAILLAFGAGIGATQGNAMLGGIGAIVGIVLGAAASVWCFFKIIVPWRVRRVLPLVIEQGGGQTFDAVRHADERVKRMVEAYDRREGPGPGGGS